MIEMIAINIMPMAMPRMRKKKPINNKHVKRCASQQWYEFR